jgi:ATPase subunit of ABC transporter with duplicated ATPase domains
MRESVDWLEQFLCAVPGTVVGVTHDRFYFLIMVPEFWSWIAARYPVEGQLQLVAGL